MNKQRFIEFIRKPKTLTLQDLEELKGVVSDYPYFQNARAILAKGSKLNNLPDADKRVANAAVYAPDRIFLKKYLTDEIIFLRTIKVTESVGDEPTEQKSSAKTLPKLVIETPQVKQAPSKPIEKPLPPVERPSAPEEKVEKPTIPTEKVEKPSVPIERTEKPSVSIEKVEKPPINERPEPLDKIPETPVSLPKPAPPVQAATPKPITDLPAAPEQSHLDELIEELQHDIEDLRRSRARLNEIEKRIEEEDAVSKALEKAESSKAPKKTKDSSATPSEKKKPLSKADEAPKASNPPKKKADQTEIIEEFLQKSPAMPINTQAKAQEKSTSDLSADSGKFNPEVASEYLAEIFIEQGRKDRAQEIYKTLSLKFPEKSTYFADLIKKLDS